MRLLTDVRHRVQARPEAAPVITRIGRWPLLVGLGYVVQVALRLVLSAGVHVPSMYADEPGYLLAGRLLAGGAGGDYSGYTYYNAGFPLLLVPAYWASDDFAVVYRLILIILALISAAMLPLAYLALRRVGMSCRQAYVIATITALLPSGFYYTQYAMCETALSVVVLGFLALVYHWVDTGRLGYGIAASGVAAYSHWVHTRGVFLIAAFAVVLCVGWRSGWVGRSAVGAMTGVLLAVLAVGLALNGWVRSQLYPRGAAHAQDVLRARLAHPLTGAAWTLCTAAGKIWYLIVSTWGVAGVGLVVLAVVALRAGTPRATRVVAAMAVTMTVGIAVASSAATPDEGTIQNFAFGRYLVCLAPVLFMAAAVFAVRATPRLMARAALASGGIMVVAAGIVWLYAGERLTTEGFAPGGFPEICFLTWTWNQFRLWPATFAALLLLLVIAAITMAIRDRRSGLLVGAAILGMTHVVAAVAFTANVTYVFERQVVEDLSIARELRPADRVGVDYVGLCDCVWITHVLESRHGLVSVDRFGRSPLPAYLTLVVVPWDPGTPPQTSWPAAPSTWRTVTTRRSWGTGGFAVWRRTT